MKKQIAIGIVKQIILSSEKWNPEIITAWNFPGQILDGKDRKSVV